MGSTSGFESNEQEAEDRRKAARRQSDIVFNEVIAIKESRLHGHGIFATQAIKRGEWIIDDSVLPRLPPNLPGSSELHRQARALSSDQLVKLVSLAQPSNKACSGLVPSSDTLDEALREEALSSQGYHVAHFLHAIFWDRALNMSPLGYKLFAVASLVNHSCKPNACVMWDPRREVMTIRAVSDVEKDEELAIAYADICNTREARYALLKFACLCEVCGLPLSESKTDDEMRHKLARQICQVRVFQRSVLGGDSKNDIRKLRGEWTERQARRFLQKAAVRKARRCVAAVLDMLWRAQFWHPDAEVVYEPAFQPCLLGHVAHLAGAAKDEWLMFDLGVAQLQLVAHGLGLEHTRCERIVQRLKMFAAGDAEHEQKLAALIACLAYPEAGPDCIGEA